jgi:multicomponent Na+:H+ antiporter subunit C
VSRFLLFALTSAALIALAVYAFVAYASLLRKVLALNVMGSAIFLLLVAVAHRNRLDVPDPVPHAMVLTGIVVAVSATAFALTLARRIRQETSLDTLPGEDDLG